MNRKPTYTHKITPACRLCGAPFQAGKDAVLRFVATPPGDKYVPAERKGEVIETVPLDILLCSSCGGAQTSAVVDPEYLYRHYLSRPAAVNSGLSGAFLDYAKDVLGRFSSKGGLAVELGSNDGIFSRNLIDNGLRAVGVEPAINLAKQATDAGLQTYPDFFTPALAERIKQEHGPADVVIANHMFANIDDVDSVMRGVDILLKPSGVMCLQTFYMMDVMQKRLLENFNHEHLSYFSVAPLRKFFAKHRMELFEVQRVPAKGGSIRCFIQRKGGARPIHPSVAAAIAEEAVFGLANPQSYQSVAQFVKSIRDRLHQALEPIRASGKKIAAYGTSIGATTFTYQYDLGGLLAFYVDDDTYRQGLISPGFEHRVVSREALQSPDVGAVVVLAPLYVDQIVENNKAVLQRGVKFYKIWPDFQVLEAAK
jgi:hypothetical protein